LARQDPEDHRAGAVKAVDPGMMLDRDDVDAEIVAQQVLVEAFLEQLRTDLRVAISVGQAGAHRRRRVEDLLRHEGVDVLAMIPGSHVGFSGSRSELVIAPKPSSPAEILPDHKAAASARSATNRARASIAGAASASSRCRRTSQPTSL